MEPTAGPEPRAGHSLGALQGVCGPHAIASPCTRLGGRSLVRKVTVTAPPAVTGLFAACHVSPPLVCAQETSGSGLCGGCFPPLGPWQGSLWLGPEGTHLVTTEGLGGPSDWVVSVLGRRERVLGVLSSPGPWAPLGVPAGLVALPDLGKHVGQRPSLLGEEVGSVLPPCCRAVRGPASLTASVPHTAPYP